MMRSDIMKKAVLGSAVAATAMAAAAVLGTPAFAAAGTVPYSGPTQFGQVAAAPVDSSAPINQIVGTNGAPLVNLNLPCTAPWNQGGVLGSHFNACSAAPEYQQNATMVGGTR